MQQCRGFISNRKKHSKDIKASSSVHNSCFKNFRDKLLLGKVCLPKLATQDLFFKKVVYT